MCIYTHTYVCVLSRSVMSDSATPWTVACQTPLSLGILQARLLGWVAMPSSRGPSQPRSWIQVSCIAGRFFTSWATGEAHIHTYIHPYIRWNTTQPLKRMKNDTRSKVDGPRDYRTKQSKSERDRQVPYDITYLWNGKYETNWHISETKRLTIIENRLVVCQGGEGGREGKDWEFGISRCRLLRIGWTNKSVLLCSTGNYIQYLVINYNGIEYEREYIFICIIESFCC